MTERWLVEWNLSTLTGPEEAKEILEDLGVKEYWTGKILGFGSMVADSRTAERLRESAFVRRVVPDQEVNITDHIPVKLPRAFNLSKNILPGQIRPHLGIPGENGRGGKGIKVAILDTGIDPNHPSCSGFIKKTAIPDDDGVDRHGHGTHVACIAAGRPTESPIGHFEGIAPEATLTSYKCLNDNGSGLTSWVINAMEQAVEDGNSIISMSLGIHPGQADDPIALAVETLQNEAIFVVAAGNQGPQEDSITAPGVSLAAFTVGSVSLLRKPWKRSSFSSIGPGPHGGKPDFSLPGGNISDDAVNDEMIYAPSTGLMDEQSTGTKSGWAALAGTSMATPIAAGMAARGKNLLDLKKGKWDRFIGHHHTYVNQQSEENENGDQETPPSENEGQLTSELIQLGLLFGGAYLLYRMTGGSS